MITCTELTRAAHNGDLGALNSLLKFGVNPNEVDSVGDTALFHASYRSRCDVMGILAQAGADLEWRNSSGRTCLMAAAIQGQVHSTRTLIGLGADINGVDDYGRTALMWASHHGHSEIVTLLVKAEANLEVAQYGEKYVQTAVVLAALQGHVTVVDYLLACGASEDAKSCGGCGIIELLARSSGTKYTIHHKGVNGCAGITIELRYTAIKYELYKVEKEKNKDDLDALDQALEDLCFGGDF